jgi:DNA-binding NarL/FixJ family response regulator
MISVVIVDDHAIIREGLKAILSHSPDISICGEAGSLVELQQVLATCSPSVILLDLSMEHEESGFTALKMIQEYYPTISVIIISVLSQVNIVRRALSLGAKGYVAKHEAASHILKALQAVASGEIYVTPETIRDLFAGDQPVPDGVPTTHEQLTRREEEIVNLIGSWYSTKEIATMLNISHSTVGTHIENIKAKLGVVSKHELVQIAIAHTKK